MKKILLTTLLFILSHNLYAEQSQTIKLHNEIEDEIRGSGISINFKSWNRNSLPIIYGGFSISTLKANVPLENDARDQIYPIYGFIGSSLNYPISPFIELGLDIGDIIEDKSREGDIFEVDIYYSMGVTITFDKAFDISFYHKTYNLYFTEILDTTRQDVYINITGISLSFYL